MLGLLAVVMAEGAHANEVLLSQAGCLGCHHPEQRLIGPSLKEIANAYRGRPEAKASLTTKLREGGEGVWGDIPMPPVSQEKLSDADLASVLDWLLAQ